MTNYLEHGRIILEEIDKGEYPVQVYFHWLVESPIIRKLADECEVSDESKGFEIDRHISAKIVLTIFTKGDLKIQLLVEDENRKQNWYDVCFQTTSADRLVALIPNYEELLSIMPQEA